MKIWEIIYPSNEDLFILCEFFLFLFLIHQTWLKFLGFLSVVVAILYVRTRARVSFFFSFLFFKPRYKSSNSLLFASTVLKLYLLACLYRWNAYELFFFFFFSIFEVHFLFLDGSLDFYVLPQCLFNWISFPFCHC